MISSSTLRTALVFGLALIVLILGAAFFGPRLIDMRSAVPMISAEMSRALGQPVQVRGQAFLVLVPSPRLIVKDVGTVPASGSSLTLNVEEVQADLSWGDLVLGNYTISKLNLIRPTIETTWTNAGVSGAALPRLSIERGQLKVVGLAAPIEIESFDAEITPTSSGGLNWSLSGLLDGLAIEGAGRLAAVSRNGAQNVQATIKLPEADVAVEISGVRNATEQSFTGRMNLSALHTTDALALSRALDVDPMRWPLTRQPLALRAEIKSVADQITISAGEIKVAEQTATFAGQVNRAQPSFGLNIELGNLDLTAWLPASPAQALAPQPRLLDRLLATQTPWQGELKINSQVLRLGEQMLRDLALDVRVEAAQTTVRNASITLPGQTRLSFAGLWSDDTSALEGAWRITNQDLRTVLSWLGVTADDVPAGRLTSFSANGTIQAGDKIVALNDLVLSLDASEATGRVAFGWDGATPTTVNLDIDRMALDVYGPLLVRYITLPRDPTTPPPNASSEGYGVKPLAPWLSIFAKQRGNVRIGIKQASWQDTLNGQFGLDVALNDNGADIRSLAFEDSSGAAFWLGGKVRSLDTVPVAEGVQFDVKVADVARFMRSLQTTMPAGLKALSPLALTGSVTGLLSGATVAMDGKLGPLVLKSRGTLGLTESDSKYDGSLDVAHPSANELRAALWPSATFPGKLAGPATLSAKIKAIPQQTEITDVAFQFGPHKFQALAIVNDGVDPQSISASISNIDMDWSALAPVPLLPMPKPGDWSGVITLSGPHLKSSLFDARDFSARYVAAKNAVELAEWSGKLFDGRAQVALKWAKQPDAEKPEQWAHALQGQIVINDANPALIATGLPPKGQGDLTLSFSAIAAAPSAWGEHLSGTGIFQVTLPANATLKNTGALAPLSAVVRAEVPDGRTLAAVESSGSFTMSKSIVAFKDLAIRSNAYAATFSGAMDVSRETFDLKGLLRLRDRGAIVGPSAQLVLPPVVPMMITGSMQAPKIKLDVSGAQR